VAAADPSLSAAFPGRIRRLPDRLVNKIAAGEVIERPASAVKELVENALDAGARAITVDLGDGGAALIRVGDDGEGIAAEELPLALERHATSKLGHDEDLEAIATLGFRGEALAAISAVSRFTVTSRFRRAAEGARVAGEGGVIAQQLAVPCDVGTTIEIRDLFFNTPARLKFLKSTPTELAATLRALTQLALAHPSVHLRVTHNGRTALVAPAASDLRQRAGAIWGYGASARLLVVDRDQPGLHVQGLASPPDLTRGHRDDVSLIVNGRPVRDPALFQTVLEAYRPLLPRDRFPLVAVVLELPPRDVDVNVHPTKAWVRFRHPRFVQEALITALRESLRRPFAASMSASSPPADEVSAATSLATVGTDPGGSAMVEPALQPGLFAEPAARYGPPSFGRVLGQVQDTFIVSAAGDEVFFFDQHVAHERVIFERLQADLMTSALASQALLFPLSLELSPAGRTLLERWREPLERLGFAFEGFGGQAILLRAVPSLLKGDEPRRLVESAVDELSGPKVGAPAVERALAFVACRAAVKANMPLAREEMDRLVTDLAATATPFFCPHGRPIVSRISLHDVRRDLRRTW
jgi:DNA mismatch repair protein MutL